ncbi:MAG: HAMP domain-containing sensor histidine kinase [Acidimicrobiales bacterium]
MIYSAFCEWTPAPGDLLMARLRSPLGSITSIKTKWSLVILAAVGVTAGMSQLGFALGWPVWLRPIVAGALALIAVQFLARGMTSPLRAMSEQAQKIAEGDFAGRVYPDSEDEIAQLAASLNHMAEQLAEVDRQQKEFIANASHELRTPVAAIQTQLENVVDRVTDPSPEVLHRLLQQAEHLGGLVGQLLDLSRLEATRSAPDRELVASGVLLKQIVHEAQLLHPGAQVELTLSGPLGVSADEKLLHQLFTNLVLNALRFAPVGSPIGVNASGDGEHVTIRVSDEGPGIPPELRSRVFERFWQGAGRGPTGGGGAGLGLAICKRIVDLHQGEISIHSNRPTGTMVQVRLPAP